MAKQVYDILLADAGKQIVNGDFVTGESTRQNQSLALLTEKGGAKLHPTRGVGLMLFLKDEVNRAEVLTAIQAEIEQDGQTIEELNIRDFPNIEMKAFYE